jgi:two-component system, NtrC family, response regulator AtoC
VDEFDEFESTILQQPGGSKTASLSVIVVMNGLAPTFSLPAKTEKISIGRFTGSSLVIEHETLSRMHAILRPGPPMTIEDLGSVNGTYVREERIRPGKHVPVSTGDVVRLGDVILILRSSAP